MKLTLATLLSPASASVLFALSSEPGGHGTMKSWVVNRGVCHDLAPDGFDKQASWAFVEGGLANGCFLYAEAGCKGNSTYIEKNNSNALGPGPVDLRDVGFDKEAGAFLCV